MSLLEGRLGRSQRSCLLSDRRSLVYDIDLRVEAVGLLMMIFKHCC